LINFQNHSGSLFDCFVFNFSQALDKSQLGEIIREQEQKLDTPGKNSPKTGIFPVSFLHQPLKGKVKYLRFVSNLQC
jgi:hypothetical protein